MIVPDKTESAMTTTATPPAIAVYDGEVHIRMDQDSDLQNVLRASSVAMRWDATTRSWAFPTIFMPLVAGWAMTNNVDFPRTPHRVHTETMKVTRTGDIYHIHTPPSSAIAKALLATRWADPEETAQGITWSVHVRFAAQLAGIAARYDHDALDTFAGAAIQWRTQASINTSLAKATSLPDAMPFPTITGLTSDLMEPQAVSIHLLHSNKCIINADEQGLGKTLQALSAARVTGRESQRLLVVCPSNLSRNWMDEMGEHFTEDTFTPHIAAGRTVAPIPPEINAVIVGWPNLSYWVETLREWNPDMAVFDEAHYAKQGGGEDGTERGAAFLDMCSHVAKNGLVCALTGTPISNRPIELLPLLQATGAISYYGGSDRYCNRYCNPKQTRDGMSYRGNSHTDELNELLCASGNYLRRTKEFLVKRGVLQPKYVDGSEYYGNEPERPLIIKGDVLTMGRYYRARRDIVTYLVEEARKTNPNISIAALRRKFSDPGSREFRELATLRKVVAQTKTGYITHLVDALIAEGEKVVIAANHREIVDLYATRYGDCRIQGGMTTKNVEKAKHRFNTLPVEECPVLVLSIEAGKTGHTLCKQPQYPAAGQACARMIIAEQGWVPGDEAQTQDRIWRIGQPREVRIANVLVEDTTDIMIYGVRKKKQYVVSEVTDGRTIERESAGGVFVQLFDEVLGTV